MSEPKRIVGHFSCGAASAVAIKLVIERNKVAPGPLPFEIIYCHVKEEHPDNARFLSDCEKWFGMPVRVLQDTRYGGSVVRVISERKFIKNKEGAPCTLHLKKEVGRAFEQHGDLNIYGYTSEEEHRLDRWIDANGEKLVCAPLIEGGLDKGACLAIIERAGIKLPVMYAMGYDHNNCIGCVKAGAWYWNKIRVDFPERFAQQIEIEEAIGHPTLRVNHVGVWLRDLEPGRGRRHEEPKIECGVACEMQERDIYGAGLI